MQEERDTPFFVLTIYFSINIILVKLQIEFITVWLGTGLEDNLKLG